MKKLLLVLIFTIALPLSLLADDFAAQVFDLTQVKGGFDNSKKAVEIATKAYNANPNGYTENWVMAQAIRSYADYAKRDGKPNWKEGCRKDGKRAMQYAEKAVSINPKGVEGHFWYANAVATYSDGVSVVTAVREGLVKKTQTGYEIAYNTNKMYNNCGPMKGLGRFWDVLPWPLKKKEKALQYLGEFYKYMPNDAEAATWYAQALIENDKEDQAKPVLQKAAASSDKYYSEIAKAMLKKL